VSKTEPQQLTVAVIKVSDASAESPLTLSVYTMPKDRLRCDPARGVTPLRPDREKPARDGF
jgi:hypothetical protein